MLRRDSITPCKHSIRNNEGFSNLLPLINVNMKELEPRLESQRKAEDAKSLALLPSQCSHPQLHYFLMQLHYILLLLSVIIIIYYMSCCHLVVGKTEVLLLL